MGDIIGVTYPNDELNLMIIQNHFQVLALHSVTVSTLSVLAKMIQPEIDTQTFRDEILKQIEIEIQRLAQSDPRISDAMHNKMIENLKKELKIPD